MEYWLVREKLEQVVVVEHGQKETRRPRRAEPPSPRLRRSGRPLLLVAKQPEQGMLRRALVALPVWQSDRLGPAFFAPGPKL